MSLACHMHGFVLVHDILHGMCMIIWFIAYCIIMFMGMFSSYHLHGMLYGMCMTLFWNTWKTTWTLLIFGRTLVWNQGLVNLDFDDNKTRFRTNDHISSVIRQDDFQSGNHKDKSSQGEIMKKKTISKRSVFQDPSFIRSLCKVIGALGFSCITFFTYAPKSSNSYFVLNILRIEWFHVFN